MPEFTGALYAHERLDWAVRQIQPHLSLRAARRLIVLGYVKVNGKSASPAYRLREKDIISFTLPKIEAAEKPEFVASQGDYLFYYKRAGLHTAAVVGGGESLENLLRAAMPEPPQLLQRLDKGTAGLVLAAANEEAARKYRQAELAGQCRKTYLAVLSGVLASPCRVKNALDVNGGKFVKVRSRDAQPLLWTHFEPLANRWNLTLAAVNISCGQRHQIRAHAASIGHPLWGDRLYGDMGQTPFILEHCSLNFHEYYLTWLHPASPLREMFPKETELWLEAMERPCM